jgi:hypothetical protein
VVYNPYQKKNWKPFSRPIKKKETGFGPLKNRLRPLMGE